VQQEFSLAITANNKFMATQLTTIALE